MTKRRIAKQATAFLLIAVILVTMAILPQTTTLVIPQAQAFAQAIPFMIGAGILLVGLYLVACQGMTFGSVKDMQDASSYVWDNMTNDQRDIWMSSIEGQLLLSGMSLVDAIRNGISGEEIDMRSFIKKFVLSLGITEAVWDAFVKNLFAIQATTVAFTMPESAYVPSVIPRYTGDMTEVNKAMQSMPMPTGYIGYYVMISWSQSKGYYYYQLKWVTSSPYIEKSGDKWFRVDGPSFQAGYDVWNPRWDWQQTNNNYITQTFSDDPTRKELLITSTVPILGPTGKVENTTRDRPAGALPEIPLDKSTTIDWRETDQPYRVRVPTTAAEVAVPPSTLVIPTPPKELTIDDFMAELTDHIAAIGEVLAPPRDQADYREIMEKMRRYMEHINKRARDGAVTGSLLGQLAEILARLRQALQRLRQNGKTDEAVDGYTDALTDALTDAGELAKRLGYEEEETDVKPLEGEIDWGRLKEGWSGLGAVFPFCIPFDIINMFTSLVAEPEKIPPIKANILPFLPGDVGMIEIDLAMDEFDGIRKIARIGLLMLFCLGLAITTSRVMKW